MHDYQKTLLHIAVEQNILQFGQFALKSGRISPYFFDMGRMNNGAALQALGTCYAQGIAAEKLSFDVLFGPAYKGIPLATTTAVALNTQYERSVGVCFNRKEEKKHGEGGRLLGHSLENQRVLILDDVLTAGTAIRESVELITAAGGQVAGALLALDRQETLNNPNETVMQTLSKNLDIPFVSLIQLQDVLKHLENEPALIAHQEALRAYQAEYCVQ